MERNILELILDGRKEPMNLPLTLLEDITGNFSKEQEIGWGQFATVYKGILPNGYVAVKRIMNIHLFENKLFHREVNTMLDVNHKNVVRFLGYCSNTETKVIKIDGSRQHTHAEVRERLLCFEHASNGDLHKHITDELRGLEWNTRYQLIQEICDGLHHLHQHQHILHMDLTPSNILLDDQMTPKIAGFRLSRLNEQSETTSSTRFLSTEYCAPEYLRSGKMSIKSDVYSLGVIIMELVTGHRGNPNINNVLRRWKHRWRQSGKEKTMGYQQVTKCIEIALLCQEIDPLKRPFIWDVLRDISEMESTNWQINNVDDQISPYSANDMLGIEPLELHFSFELNKQISSSLELTNETGACITFNIQPTSPLQYCIDPNKGIVLPRSKCIVNITLESLEKAPEHMQQAYAFRLQSTKVQDGLAVKDITMDMFKEETGKVVDEVNLDVVFDVVPQSDLLDIHQLELSFPFEPHNLNPVVVTQKLLKAVTDDFSSNSELGRGGYGVVYKGVFPTGEIIAVKKLSQIHLVKDVQFHDEVSHLTGIKHKNIVQTLGYCDEISWELIPQPTGNPIWAETPKRLICFEYVPNKSLDKYISDESHGLDWKIRYKIIKGICKGLHFLHEECQIVHLDLKPENILMDAAMVPKIADFGSSKMFGYRETQLIITDNRVGSIGYMAPEYWSQGLITAKADMFSLGLIIINLVTGCREYPLSSAYFQFFGENDISQSTETYFEDYIDEVVERWTDVFASTLKYKMTKYIQQVKRCITMALNCVDPNMEKRPTVKYIIEVLTGVDQVEPEITRSKYGSNDKPVVFKLKFLKDITCTFSEDMKLQEHQYGTDYKGVLPNGEIIVVKDFSITLYDNDQIMEDNMVHNNVSYLTGIKNQHVVQFLGSCAESILGLIEIDGRHIQAEMPGKFLCFEYVCNGGLDKYIYGIKAAKATSSAKPDMDWDTRFKIIKGICQGLCFLHNLDNPIIHNSLQPANILLDADMMPKIEYSALSRVIGQETTQLFGPHGLFEPICMESFGYMAPELVEKGEISAKSDIYSLGVLIIEITTGEENRFNYKQPSARKFIDKVREDWTLEHITFKYESLDLKCIQQVKACINIGLKCVEIDQSCRPSMVEILDMLNEYVQG